jgi:putative transposase
VVTLLAKAHLTVKRQRQDFHHKKALGLVRAYDTSYHEDLHPANMVRNHYPPRASPMRGGRRSSSSSHSKQHTLGSDS